jgi:FG-GAP repeat
LDCLTEIYAIIRRMRWDAAPSRLLGLALVFALGAPDGGVHARAGQGEAVANAAPTAAQIPGFRLGTAARPFAWSTAVGDLNADGRPDFAIADRIGRRAAGFAYAIELTIAGGPSESVAFDSDQDSLTVTLRDVDRDRDLDVVVTATLSRSIVAVWLNDGTGRFRRAAPETLEASWRASSSALTDRPRPEITVDESIARSGPDGVSADDACADLPLPISTLATCGPFRTARASLSALRPRAPPAIV